MRQNCVGAMVACYTLRWHEGSDSSYAVCKVPFKLNAMNIEDYRFGWIVIDGQSYTSDVIVFPDRVNDSWWRNEGHELCPADLWEVVQEKPAVLVVGTGRSGLMRVLAETEEYLERQGIKLVIERTAEACQTFNRLSRSGERVVAALHLTC